MERLRKWSTKHLSQFTLFLLAAVTLLSINILTRDYHYLESLASITASYERPIMIIHPPKISVAGTTNTTSPSVEIKNLGIPDKTIAGGDEGDAVLALQKFLQSQGFLPSDEPLNGYFGPKTEKAIRKYQEARGLEVTGRVGPLTRESWAKDLGLN
ncbi:peptidoglycan-binding protein [Candidatus Parcubacteria bacterium]|nr:peptidoglycan-binding protein [Candidatus Parcubacteria bacterium]